MEKNTEQLGNNASRPQGPIASLSQYTLLQWNAVQVSKTKVPKERRIVKWTYKIAVGFSFGGSLLRHQVSRWLLLRYYSKYRNHLLLSFPALVRVSAANVDYHPTDSPGDHITALARTITVTYCTFIHGAPQENMNTFTSNRRLEHIFIRCQGFPTRSSGERSHRPSHQHCTRRLLGSTSKLLDESSTELGGASLASACYRQYSNTTNIVRLQKCAACSIFFVMLLRKG
jgi:hypothetical protein